MCATGAHYDDLKPAPLWANVVASVTRRLPRGKSRVIDWVCRRSSERFVGKMCGQLGGYEFDCSLRNRMAREVFFGGCAAAQEIAFARAVLQPGMNFVDVGANWGLFTLVAAHRVGTAGSVVALEPHPQIFAMLKSNVRRNNLQQVRVFDVAAADRNSHRILAAHDAAGDNWGTSRLVEDGSAAQNTLTVRSRRLESLLDEIGLDKVDLLKIDVEGAEDMVLAGMEAGLKAKRYSRILLELHPLALAERGRDVRDVIGVLMTEGYKGYALDHSQAGVRKAYYSPWLHFFEFVRALEQGLKEPLPHTIWLSPDQPGFGRI